LDGLVHLEVFSGDAADAAAIWSGPKMRGPHGVEHHVPREVQSLGWTGTDRPSVLFDRATTWLVTQKVLLPGATALERLVARICGRAARPLWRSLSRNITHEQRSRLDALLLASEGGRPSPLDRLRDGPLPAQRRRAVPRHRTPR
jgi:hypothetical protein